jgi:hypothetical protein
VHCPLSACGTYDRRGTWTRLATGMNGQDATIGKLLAQADEILAMAEDLRNRGLRIEAVFFALVAVQLARGSGGAKGCTICRVEE